MIRLPILKDELAFLEKHLPELEGRTDLGQLATEFKKRIAQIRREINTLEREQSSKWPTTNKSGRNAPLGHYQTPRS
jgi:hypothetical protein